MTKRYEWAEIAVPFYVPPELAPAYAREVEIARAKLAPAAEALFSKGTGPSSAGLAKLVEDESRK